MVKYELFLAQMTKTWVIALQIIFLFGGIGIAVLTSWQFERSLLSYASSIFAYSTVVLGFYLIVVTGGQGKWNAFVKIIFGGVAQGTLGLASTYLGGTSTVFFIIGASWGIIISLTIFVFIAGSAKAI